MTLELSLSLRQPEPVDCATVPTAPELLADPLDRRAVDALQEAFTFSDHTTQLLVGLIGILRTELGDDATAELAVLQSAAERIASKVRAWPDDSHQSTGRGRAQSPNHPT